MSTSVLYSIAMPLNRGGMGTIATHACKGLMNEGLLFRALAPEVRAAKDLEPLAFGLPLGFQNFFKAINRFGWHYTKDCFFDYWASAWLSKGVDFYGWMHQSLASIRRCHAQGGRTFIDRGSVESKLQQQWLQEEYAKFGLKSEPIPELTLQRMLREADETDIIVTPSTLVFNSYLAAGFMPCRLRLNPLGVDRQNYYPPTQKRKSDVVRFAFVGQLSIQKGLPDLLQAWRAVAHNNMELVLAGVVPQQEKSVVLPLLRDTPHVVSRGHCSDIASLLRECDVLVLPSAQDGFGLVVLEALATGIPVIVSDRVGAKDCVVPEKNGFIFGFGDMNHLKHRLQWFGADQSRSVLMSGVCLETARQYSWENYGKRLALLVKTRD